MNQQAQASMEDIQKLISASLLRLRMKSPFFATLALFAKFIPSIACPTAATDGNNVFFNETFLRSLPTSQVEGLLLHEVLHAALMHGLRRGVRDPQLWNVAADIVVNGMIIEQGEFELPDGGLRDPELEHLSVEEVYELLLKEAQPRSCPNLDLLDPSSQPGNPCDDSETMPSSEIENSLKSQAGDSLSQAQKSAIEAHWRNALQQAMVVARTARQGKVPAGFDRELGMLSGAQLDWRSHLWRYLVQTPTDFSGFDRRFVHQGLYLEMLVGESVQVYVAVDTSGSIDKIQLRMFLSEVQGILNSYPHLRCELYYVDAEAYGPHELNSDSSLPQPQGGGGTSFVPFFEKVSDRWDQQTQAVCVYLTDGYGIFPDQPPELSTLWVVTPGGLELEAFPFGEAVRLLSL
jgi:predicted metal-dependent peptidase